MKKSIKVLSAVFTVIFISLCLTACLQKKVSFEDGWLLFSEVQSSAQESTHLDVNHNYSYESNTDVYYSDVKRFLPSNITLKSFSYYKNEDNSTVTVFGSNKDCDSMREYHYTSERYTYGYNTALEGFYEFCEFTDREKNGADSSEFKKRKVNDFDLEKTILLKSNYYFEMVKEFYAILTDNPDCSALSQDDLSGAKFSKKDGLYTIKLSVKNKLESGRITKDFILKFDAKNIKFVEIITKTYDNTDEMIEKVWNQLDVIYTSGRAEIPKNTDNFTDF